MKYTASKFKKDSIIAMVKVKSKTFNHGDFALGKNAREYVYDKIIKFMKVNEDENGNRKR